jgi:hypothetical protein
MAIDIAYYISEIERGLGKAQAASKDMGISGGILHEHIINILLPICHTAALKLEKEIFSTVSSMEGESWPAEANELNLLAFGTILTAWASWCFKAKSDDPNRDPLTRRQAAVVDKYIKTMINNAINAGRTIGTDNGRPEGREELIGVSY